jgi:hypothetical protein
MAHVSRVRPRPVDIHKPMQVFRHMNIMFDEEFASAEDAVSDFTAAGRFFVPPVVPLPCN